MKRWFVARMGDYENDGSLVPKTNLYPCNSRTWVKTGMTWCFGQLATDDLSGLSADPDIKLIPEAAMDNMLSTIPAAVRTAMRNNLTAAGFDISAVTNTWTIRQLLKHLRIQLQGSDDIESGDVHEPSLTNK